MRILIDPQARVWEVERAETYRQFGLGGSAEDLMCWAVARHGCVGVARGPRLWRLMVCRQNLSEIVIEMVAARLDHDPRRVVIEQVAESQPAVDLMLSVGDVLTRLRSLHERAGSGLVESRFESGDMALEDLKLGPPALDAAYRHWRRRRGLLTASALRRCLDQPLGGSQLLARIGPDGEPVSETLPGYVKFWGQTDLSRLIQAPLVEHPDRRYGMAVAGGFRRVDRLEAPHLEIVDALVQAEGQAPHRLRYDRLLLPWRAADGSRFVSSSSYPRLIRALSA